VFIASWCWVWRDVRKKTVKSFLNACLMLGPSAAAVFPSPVGACTMRFCCSVTALLIFLINSSCMGLTSSCGNNTSLNSWDNGIVGV